MLTFECPKCREQLLTAHPEWDEADKLNNIPAYEGWEARDTRFCCPDCDTEMEEV